MMVVSRIVARVVLAPCIYTFSRMRVPGAAMRAFSALPDNRLVEENRALRELLSASEKLIFFTSMASISSSSSTDSRSNVDVMRRGAPAPVEVETNALLVNIPPASVESVCSAWDAFEASDAREWIARPRSSVPSLREVALVHPSVGCALRAAAPRTLRVWHDKVAADDVPHAEVRPDFTLSDARDATSSTVGGLVLVEAKLPHALIAAVTHTSIILRRRVYKLCCEADARGEAMDGFLRGASRQTAAGCPSCAARRARRRLAAPLLVPCRAPSTTLRSRRS